MPRREFIHSLAVTGRCFVNSRTSVALHGFSWAPLCWSAVVFVVTQGCWRFAGEMRDAHAVWL